MTQTTLSLGLLGIATGAVVGAAVATFTAATPAPVPSTDPDTVLFVVLDTVRSQNTSLCGYERPNTPFLSSLRDEDGASVACRAYSPGAWTLPSHGSYFSGLAVPEHGIVKAGQVFPEEPRVLAEIFRRKGYRTALVSGNAALGAHSGLQRGFQVTVESTPQKRMWGDQAANAVRRILSKAQPDDKVFLFVNIYDAHDPYPAIPPGVGWVPEQPEIDLHAQESDPTVPFNLFTRGQMDPAETEGFLRGVTDGYDYGIYVADQGLKEVFAALDEVGRLDRPLRYLITSDHGEFLGEHGNLRHGCFVYEEVTRVPFVYKDTTLTRQPVLEEPFSATNAFFLLRDGMLPPERIVPNAVTRKRQPGRPSADMAGLWPGGDEKIVWKDGAYLEYDLSRDPGEQAPTELGDHPMRPQLEQFAERHQAVIKEHLVLDPALKSQLEALGYTDD